MFSHKEKNGRKTLRSALHLALILVLSAQLFTMALPKAQGNSELLVNNESFNSIDTGDGTSSRELRFGNSSLTMLYNVSQSRFEISRSLQVGGTLTATGSVIAKATVSGTTLRVSGNADVQGALTASGAVRFDAGLTLNDDDTAIDTTLQFGVNIPNGKITFGNLYKEFSFNTGIRVAGSISGSGALVFEGAASGSSLYLGTSLQGAGLTTCSNGTNDKLLWNSATGRFSCGSDQTGVGGSSFGSGNVITIGNTRYVSKQGDTMTGALTIQNGNTHTATTTPLLNTRGTMSGRNLYVTGTGAAAEPLIFGDITKGYLGIGKNTAKAKLDVAGTISGSLVRASTQLFSSGSLAVEGNSFLDDSVYVDAASNRTAIGAGRQGITPKTTLEVGGTVSGSLLTQNGAGNNYMRGNLGIGNTSPTNALTVSSSTATQGLFYGFSSVLGGGALVSDGEVRLGSDASGFARLSHLSSSGDSSAGTFVIDNVAAGNMVLRTNLNTSSFTGAYLDGTNKRFGINKNAPKATLDVAGTVSGSLLTQNGAGNNYFMGNLGLGKLAPSVKFDVVGTVSGSLLTQNGAGNNYFMGNVGIGKTVPTTKFETVGTVSGTTLRVSGNADVQGALTASGAVRFDSNLTLNDDLGGSDVTLTFGNSVSNGILTYSNTFREFSFDHGIRVAGSISGSGTLVFEGAASGSSLYLGTSLNGAGLTSCSNGVNDKLLWNSTSGRFSCGSDQGGAGGGLSYADATGIFVNQGGDTMTGALNIQNGTVHTPTATPLLNTRGTMSGRSLQITGTGSKPLLFSDITKGYFGIGTDTPTSQLTMSGGTFLQIAGGAPRTLSGVDLGANVNGVYVSGNYTYVVTDANASNGEVRTIDISDPTAPTIVGSYETAQNMSTIFVSTKHIFVGMSGSAGGSGMLILDNSNPGRQTLVGRINFGIAVKSIYVSGKFAYVGLANKAATLCSTKAQNFSGCDFVTVDFTNANAPMIVSGIKFSSDVNALYIQNRYAYVGLGSVAGNDFRIVDLQNPYNIATLGGVDYTNTVNAIYVSGKYAFLGLNADAGNPEFRVVNVGDKNSPSNAGSFETGIAIKAITVLGDWGRIGMASGGGDDYITLDMRNPLTPKKVGGIDFGTDVNSIFIAGKFAYVGIPNVSGNDMRIIDLNGIEAPAASIGSIATANLTVADNARFDNNMYVRNALNVGRGGIISKGPLSIQSASSGSFVSSGTGTFAQMGFEVRNSTGQTLFSVADDGIISGGIPNSTTGSNLQFAPHPVWGRTYGYAIPITTTATALTSSALSTLTPVNTGTSGVGISGDRIMVKYATQNTSGNAGGIIGPYTTTRPGYRPRYTAVIRTSTGTVNLRFWGGLAESSPIALAPSLASAATTIDYVAMAWEDTVNGGKWMCCSGDGTNHTCTDMGAPPVATNTVYFLDVDWSQLGKLTCRLIVNGRVYTTVKKTNLSVAGTNLGVQTTITTKVTGGNSVCRNFSISKIAVEQN